jgi:flavorubredoxin
VRIVVVYDSQFGNTATVAQAIGRGAAAHGHVAVLPVVEADTRALFAEPVDLLFVGGPTLNRRMSPPLARWVDEATAAMPREVAVATFDTRFKGSELLMGSAGKAAATNLRRAGAALVAPRESFYVARAQAPGGVRTPPGMARLVEGEEARAEAWGGTVAGAAASR